MGDLVARVPWKHGALRLSARSPVLATHKTCRDQEGAVSEGPVGVRHICTPGITQKAPARSKGDP
jgi:hypothetical protein